MIAGLIVPLDFCDGERNKLQSCGACGEAEETFAVAVIVTLGKCHTGTKLLTAPSLSPQLGQRQPPLPPR